MPPPRNIDLFSNDDIISWSGKTDDCKEIIFPRNSDLFPNFSIDSYLLERGNRCFGETGSLAASDLLQRTEKFVSFHPSGHRMVE